MVQEAPKILVLVDHMTQKTRVFTNAPNLMVEVTELSDDDPDFDRDVELFKREYPYQQFGEDLEDEEES
jgi:hypothetical protein